MIRRSTSESKFFNPQTGEYELFPNSLENPSASLNLSVIVPAYNEQTRLPVMMDEALGYLESRASAQPLFSYEVIVVDDGSSDNTSQVALRYSEKYSCNKVRVQTLEENRGKGGAVQLGMLSSRGRQVLFADADGATKFSDVERLEKALDQLPNIEV